MPHTETTLKMHQINHLTFSLIKNFDGFNFKYILV